MEAFKVWIALSPGQLVELNKGNEVLPDEFSGRLGLHTCPAAAVDRAQYFMDWTPDGLKGEHHQKDYAGMEMEISALGYLQKVEGGILQEDETNGVSLVWPCEAVGSCRTRAHAVSH